MKTILTIEDEPHIQEMLTFFLETEGFGVANAHDHRQAFYYLLSGQPVDLILLDWMLPNVSGLDLLKEIKQHHGLSTIPVIMLTARTELEDKVTGLDAGADDYLAKPFSLKELSSRIKAVLRRSKEKGEEKPNIIEIEGLKIDTDAHRLYINGQTIEIARIEFKLLVFLTTHSEKVYSRNQLLDLVWGFDSYLDERTVDVSVGRLRKILEPSGHARMLQTVRGAGYRFSRQHK